MKSFLRGRINAIQYTVIGVWRMISKEHSFQVQLFLAVLLTMLGFYFKISSIEWMMQTFAIGMVLTTETLNTAIEEICNFVHRKNHNHIGEIKDIAAGAVLLSAIASFIVISIIYLPKIFA